MKAFVNHLVVVFILSTLSIGAYAQTKVVVIPMTGDDILPEPFAPLTANSPVRGDYTISALTVVDKVTGLEWQRQDDNTDRDWDTAFTYCISLTLDSKSDWRLPQYHELQSIVAYDKYGPAINGVAFISTVSSNYWSASSYADGSGGAWSVSFNSGFVFASGKVGTYYVRCVR